VDGIGIIAGDADELVMVIEADAFQRHVQADEVNGIGHGKDPLGNEEAAC
jgi:hypothetical protein